MRGKDNNKKNFIWNMIGLTLYCLVSLLLLIVVKRINGTDDAGLFSYAFSICTLFLYLAMFYNRTYQVANSKISFNSYFSTRFLTTIISVIILLLFSIVSGFDMYKISVIGLLMLFRAIDSISDCFYGALQSKECLYKVGISYTIKSILGVLFFIIVDYVTHNVLLSIISMDIINIIIFLLYDIKSYYLISKEKILLTFDNTKTIIINTISVFIFSFFSIYLSNAQKYIITYYSSNDIQMIFGILVMPATLVSLIGNYLIHPFMTKLVDYKNKNEWNLFNKLVLIILTALFIFGIIVVVLTYILGIPVINFVYNVDLFNYKYELLIIIVSSILISTSMILSGILTIIDKNKIQVGIYGFSCLVATVSCVLLIKNNIIRGASLSYFIASLVTVLSFITAYCYCVINKRRKS